MLRRYLGKCIGRRGVIDTHKRSGLYTEYTNIHCIAGEKNVYIWVNINI